MTGQGADDGRDGPNGRDGRGGRSALRRRARRGDLTARPFPDIRADDPARQRAALADLRTWAEQQTEDAIEWYLLDRQRKRGASRLLQAAAIAFAVAGTAVPLGIAAGGGSNQGWGYVLLAVAAGCKGFDHFFGLSAGWMRDMSVVQALRGELDAVRLEWAGDVLRAGPTGPSGGGAAAGPLDAAEVERQLALVDRLVTAVRGQIESETADWRTEFSSRTRQLQEQGAGLPPDGR